MFGGVSTRAFVLLLIFRLLNSLFVVTYFNPDEHWQSLEVAHDMVYGYGVRTWEFSSLAKIRSYAHPLLFAALYKLLQLTQTDSPFLVAYAPRLLQGATLAVADCFIYGVAYKRFHSERIAKFVLFAQTVNWFTAYCGVRTYANSAEYVLTVIALYYWPQRKGVIFAATAFCIRPTNIIVFAIITLIHFIRLPSLTLRLRFVLDEIVPVALCALIVMTIIDSYFYGELTLSAWNFFRFNALYNIGALYGVHAAHWYWTEAWPAMTASLLPFVIYGIYRHHKSTAAAIYSYDLLITLILTTIIYSFAPHKEYRFLLPLLPICMMYAGVALEYISRTYTIKNYYRIILFIITTNLLLWIYLSLYHQAAPISLMAYLREHLTAEFSLPVSASSSSSLLHSTTALSPVTYTVDLIMPCHSTPYYSHLHIDSASHHRVVLRSLDCSPLFNESGIVNGGWNACHYTRQLQTERIHFVRRLYAANDSDEDYRCPLSVNALSVMSSVPSLPRAPWSLPTYIAAYDDLLDRDEFALLLWLKQHGFELVATFADGIPLMTLSNILLFRRR